MEVGHLPKEISKVISNVLKEFKVEAAANVLAETERGSKGGKGLEITIKVDLKADDMRLLNRLKQKINKKVEIISIK